MRCSISADALHYTVFKIRNDRREKNENKTEMNFKIFKDERLCLSMKRIITTIKLRLKQFSNGTILTLTNSKICYLNQLSSDI